MTLRFKSFVIAISFIIVLSVFFSVSYYYVFLSYSRDVEARFAEDSIERIYTSLNLEIKDFTYICSSYSDWVRTYNFVENPDSEYINENLKESDFENFGFNFVAIADLQGNVLYADSYNYLLKLGLKSIIRKIFNNNSDRLHGLDHLRAIAILQKSHVEVMRLIDTFTNEQLFTRKFFDWTGTTSLGSYCFSATSSHYDWAMKKIKKHKKELK